VEPLTAHRRAADAFAKVLSAVAPEQLGAPTPCSDWNVKAVIDHVIAGNNRVAGSSADGTADLTRAYADAADAAHATFSAPDGLTRVMDMPFGKVPGGVFIGIRTIDTLVHAWDVATATGQSTDLDPELAEAMLEVARERMTPAFRGPGKQFGDEQPCPPDRSAADRLAAFMGRPVE
jgi:uncharacterized protein (TIGR03086 family)